MTRNRMALLAQFNKRWVGAGLAATGAVAAADQANAAIIHQAPVGGVNVPSTFAGNYLNLETGVGNTVSGATNPGWDINPYGATYLRMFSNNGVGSVSGFRGPAALAQYDNLAPGTLVCATDTFKTGVLNQNPLLPVALSSSNNLFGFKFTDAAAVTHVGWVRMSIGATAGGQPRSIVEWAYNTDPAGCVSAGVVPEPGSLALLAAGAIGLVARRRRQS